MSDAPPPAAGREVALVALAALAFATASPLAKVAHGLSWPILAAGRCAVAAAVLWAVGGAEAVAAFRRLDGRRRLALAGAGVLLAGHFAFFLAGLLRTSLAAAAALVSLEPLAVVAAAWVAFGERPTPRQRAGLVLAMAGAAVVALSIGQGEHRLAGDALVLVAVGLFGVYVAFARGLRASLPVGAYAAWVYGVAAVALALPAGAAMAAREGAPAPSGSWLAVVALGLVPTLLGHTLVQRAARRVPAAIVALVCPGETVGAVLLGVLIGMSPSRTEWVGAVVVIAGVVVAVGGSGLHRTPA